MASDLSSQFTWSLYQKVSLGGGNVLISPHSVGSALMLACLGARGNTENQIGKALGYSGNTPAEWHAAFSQMNSQMKQSRDGDDGVIVDIANKMFARLDLDVLAKYSKDADGLYKSGTERMDFATKATECRLAINKWVEEQTNNKIQDLLPEGTISASTNLVLANAVYFKGKWDKPFEASKTEPFDFHKTATESVKVNMMRKKIDLRYTADEALKCSAVEIPYQHRTVTMTIIRPDSVDGLPELERNLSAENLSKLMERARTEMKAKVDLGLPKFKFTETTDLSRTLPELGITDLFDPSAVDLSGMTSVEGVAFTDVIHKAFVDVNEEGTEAAAATAMISRMMMMPIDEVTFICDRPFLFLITDVASSAVLFIGRFSTP